MKTKNIIAAAVVALGLTCCYDVSAAPAVYQNALIRTEMQATATTEAGAVNTARQAAAQKALDKYVVVGKADPALYNKLLGQYEQYTSDKLETMNGNIAVSVNLMKLCELVKNNGAPEAVQPALGNTAVVNQPLVNQALTPGEKLATADVAVLVRMLGFENQVYKQACRGVINDNLTEELAVKGLRTIDPDKMQQVHELESNGDDLPYSIYKEEGMSGLYAKTGVKLGVVGEVKLLKLTKEENEFVAEMNCSLELVKREDVSYVTLKQFDEVITVRSCDEITALEMLTDMLVARAGKSFAASYAN